MAVKKVVTFGHPALRTQSKNIDNFNDIRVLIDDMFDTMYENNGVGLAAPQVNKSLQILVMEEEWGTRLKRLFFQKKFSVVTFPHKTSVEIRKDHQYRVDFFTFDQFLEFLKAEHPFNILFHLIASNGLISAQEALEERLSQVSIPWALRT